MIVLIYHAIWLRLFHSYVLDLLLPRSCGSLVCAAQYSYLGSAAQYGLN